MDNPYIHPAEIFADMDANDPQRGVILALLAIAWELQQAREEREANRREERQNARRD